VGGAHEEFHRPARVAFWASNSRDAGGRRGIAYASIPDSAGVFTACRSNLSGSVRLIDTAATNPSFRHCTSSFETQVTWNQRGAPGAPGADGVSGYQVVSAENDGIREPGKNFLVGVGCPSGKSVLGGGGRAEIFSDASGNLEEAATIASSAPITDAAGNGTGWTLTIANPDGSSFTADEDFHVTVYAICAKVST
jgi:hypothetical protein